MNTPCFTLRVVTATACALVAALGVLPLAQAADSTPAPGISLEVKKTETAEASKKAEKAGSLTAGNTKSSVVYTITLHNSGAKPLPGVTLDYIIYTKTLKTSQKGTNTTTYKPTSGTAPADIPADGSQDVKTNAVTTAYTQTYSKKGTLSGTTKQEVVGIWVEAKLNDTILADFEDPLDIKEKMDAEAITKSKAGDSTDSDTSDSSPSDN
jgi:hypothetical protein